MRRRSGVCSAAGLFWVYPLVAMAYGCSPNYIIADNTCTYNFAIPARALTLAMLVSRTSQGGRVVRLRLRSRRIDAVVIRGRAATNGRFARCARDWFARGKLSWHDDDAIGNFPCGHADGLRRRAREVRPRVPAGRPRPRLRYDRASPTCTPSIAARGSRHLCCRCKLDSVRGRSAQRSSPVI